MGTQEVTKESLFMLPITPDGVPYLMQNQHLAFNGDVHLAEEFLRLRDKYGDMPVVETGTYIGTTTLWLAQHFKEVTTAEVDEKLFTISNLRFHESGRMSIFPYHAPGANILREMKDDYIGFLDAHPVDGTGIGYDVVVQELNAIAESGIKPCALVLHDFFNPLHPEMQFDKYDGKPFTFEWVKPSLDAIYGEGGYTYYHNEKATGANVGVLFVERANEITEAVSSPVA